MSERSLEMAAKNQVMRVQLPKSRKISQAKEIPRIEKTALFVPREKLWERVKFRPAKFSDQVRVSSDVAGVLEVIFKHGDVAKRYGEMGLENDPSKQQIIVYTVVTCEGQMLWYQRASKSTFKKSELLGEPRLQGKISVGFGGHKTSEDISFSRDELVFLADLLPAIRNEIGTVLGLNKGFFSEIEEELGILRGAMRSVELKGVVYDARLEDPLLPVQVGWVHTGVVAIIEIDPEQVKELVMRTSEIARAWWVPTDKVVAEMAEVMAKAQKGKGPMLEGWSEIVLKEFWD